MSKDENKKEENGEDKKPELEDRMKVLEEKVDKVLKMDSKVDKILKSIEKAEEDEDEEKQEDDKKPKEEEKKEEDEEEDKKKQEGEPKPGQSEEKLPKAPVGETDEDSPPAKDEVAITEKIDKQIEKKVKEIMKQAGITSSTTPRPKTHEVQKTKPKHKDPAMELLKKVRLGKLNQEGMNREVKKMVMKSVEEKKKLFNKLKEEE